MWTVHATEPKENLKWDFRCGYFPRKVAYKSDAKKLALEAISKGGLNVYIIKDGKKEVMCPTPKVSDA